MIAEFNLDLPYYAFEDISYQNRYLLLIYLPAWPNSAFCSFRHLLNPSNKSPDSSFLNYPPQILGAQPIKILSETNECSSLWRYPHFQNGQCDQCIHGVFQNTIEDGIGYTQGISKCEQGIRQIVNCIFFLLILASLYNNSDYIWVRILSEIGPQIVAVSIHTGIYPDEIAWRILDSTNKVLFSVPYYTYNEKNVILTTFLQFDSVEFIKLIKLDSYEDGWNGGYHIIASDGIVFSSGGFAHGYFFQYDISIFSMYFCF